MKPHFTWHAEFDDDSVIDQFKGEGEEEVLFKQIEDNKDILLKFKIKAEDGEYYEVDLKKCEINCNGKKMEQLKQPADNTKLIYSRRNQVRGDMQTGELLDQRIIHRVGLESDEERLVVDGRKKS